MLASDSFKGTLSSNDIAHIARELISEEFSDAWTLDCQLMADGGEGTVEAFSSLWGGDRREIETVGAEGDTLSCPLLLNEKGEALFEVASVIGLPLIKKKTPSLSRTTKGIGVVIREAVRLGARKIYVGLGGSSTNDLGIGMLSELGVRFEGVSNPTMANAKDISSIDASGFELAGKGIEFVCLSDVTNPLLGEDGATFVYGPQKGYVNSLGYLEDQMARLASMYEKATSKSLQKVPGLGASGGLGAAFHAFMDAEIASGIETLLRSSRFKERAEKADLIITGEGSFDEQSLQGKVFSGVRANTPKGKLVVLCGRNRIKEPGVPIYETSERNRPCLYIKEHAKEGYRDALKHVLETYR